MSEERGSIGSVRATNGLDLGSSSGGARRGPPRKPREAPAAVADDAGPLDPPVLAPIAQSVERINARLAGLERALVLRFDLETGVHVAEVTHTVTGQVLQQIPGRDLRHLAGLLQSWADGESALLDRIA